MVEQRAIASCMNTYMDVCARFREQVLRNALRLWVSELEPCLVERHSCGLGVEIIGLGAAGGNTVVVPYPAKLTVTLKVR